jgi:hypothetical protein
MFTSVSEEHIAVIFRVQATCSSETYLQVHKALLP